MYLNCHTWFSLLHGVMRPEELLEQCRIHGVAAAACTDINNTSAILDLLRLAPRYGVHLVPGIDFRDGARCRYVGIACNNEGFYALNAHLSAHLHSGRPFGPLAPDLPSCYIIYPFRAVSEGLLDPARLPGHARIGIGTRDLTRFRLSALRHQPERCVVLEPVTFRHPRDHNIHRLLRAIHGNTLLSKLSAEETADPREQMQPEAALREAFRDFPELPEATSRILRECRVHFGLGENAVPQNQRTYTGSEEEDYRLLRHLAEEGLRYRYGPSSADAERLTVRDRLEKELSVIRETGFISYFLINHDITSYARRKGYFYVGRGSGANSLVAYLLRITDVDPIELDLYFERFINLYRRNPPDFDIDFSWTDREDITRYIFNRFPHVALVGAYNTFQHRAAVRELGKVFGLPKEEIDDLGEGRISPGQADQIARLVLRYSTLIQDFPHLISPHACGILIADKPIHWYTATLLPPKGFPTTHFDMVAAEDVGLYKFDILSQRGLGKIHDTLEMILRQRPGDPPIDIHDMKRLKEDPEIRTLLREARAIGCFYVESPAMRMLLTKLRVDDYLGLVAASSVIRPGVSSSGMMKEYILRHRNPERRAQAHPVLLDIMPETYGVMVYQEDVIKVAHFFAGLDLGEADSLRRGMSGKFRGREEFELARASFFAKAAARGHRAADITEIWRQTESFAGYAFAKGHSASYAVESYQSLFLKAHYPLEYMTATINNSGGFYSTEIYVHEARRHGARIEPPCVNAGGAHSALHDRTIILGLGLLASLRTELVDAILRARLGGGPFATLDDFMDRVPAPLDQVCILIRSGAFRFTQRSKKDLLWEAHFRLSGARRSPVHATLFPQPARSFSLPPLEHSWIEDAYDEMELIGFPLCQPFDLLAEEPANHVTARQLPEHAGREVTIVGYLVTVKTTRTSRGERMCFGTFLDREGAFLDTVHFPPVAGRFAWQGRGIYAITGKVAEDFGAWSVEAASLRKLPYLADPRYEESGLSRHAANPHHPTHVTSRT